MPPKEQLPHPISSGTSMCVCSCLCARVCAREHAHAHTETEQHRDRETQRLRDKERVCVSVWISSETGFFFKFLAWHVLTSFTLFVFCALASCGVLAIPATLGWWSLPQGEEHSDPAFYVMILTTQAGLTAAQIMPTSTMPFELPTYWLMHLKQNRLVGKTFCLLPTDGILKKIK